MLAPFISALGISVTGIGTFIRVTPDIPRRDRRRFYRIYPMTRKFFDIRRSIKTGNKGIQYTIRDKRVAQELIDYVDAERLEDPPKEIPEKITSVAAHIEAQYPNGTTEKFVRGKIANRTLVKILTMTIERQCRNYGLLIALIGIGLTVTGTVISL